MNSVRGGGWHTCSTTIRDLISCATCCLDRGAWGSSILSHCSSILPLHTPRMDKSTAKQRDMITESRREIADMKVNATGHKMSG